MPVATLRREASAALRELAWEQWSQMGVSAAAPPRREERAIDPEALLLFTLELGRDEPRLLDEALDWLATNEHLVSVQRLRNLCEGAADEALVAAALGWVGRQRPRSRTAGSGNGEDGTGRQLVPLFRGLGESSGPPDPDFARQGFARQTLRASGKSQPPEYLAPINVAFRLRRILGVGAKAEIVRTLLTVRAPRISAQVISASAAYAPRNVREGLVQLVEAEVVDAVVVGGERHYFVPGAGWAALLGCTPPELPLAYDWVQTLRALRVALRWLHDPELEDLSEYMRASRATTLLEAISADLRYAGVPLGGVTPGGDGWSALARSLRAAIVHARGRR